MESLLRLKLTADMDMNSLSDHLIQCNGCCLEYNSLEDFKTNFNRFSLMLYENADKIKSIISFKQDTIFEADVYAISKIEDKFGIPIRSLFIEGNRESDIRSLVDFYYEDLNDGSFDLNIMSCNSRNPFYIIEQTLLSDISVGLNLSIDMNSINPIWLNEKEIFDSIYSYINSFVYEKYIQVIKG